MHGSFLSTLVAAVVLVVVAAAPAAAAPRGEYEGRLERWVRSHHPTFEHGFRARVSSAYCSPFEHRGNRNKRWRFCTVYQPYTDAHGSDDWHDWADKVCLSHWKVFWRFRRSWRFVRADDWNCHDLRPEET